jgi:E3 ubiquitin-protein ligase BRE1
MLCVYVYVLYVFVLASLLILSLPSPSPSPLSFSLSPSPPPPQMEYKTVVFRNKAMLKRLREKQRTIDDLEQRVASLENDKVTHDVTLQAVNESWQQLDSDIQLLLARLNVEESNTDTATTSTDSDSKTSSLLSRLLGETSQTASDEVDDYDDDLTPAERTAAKVRKGLQARSQFTRTALERICTAVESTTGSQQQILDKIEKNASNAPELLELVRSTSDKVNSELQQSQTHADTLASELRETRDKLARSESDVTALREQIATAQLEHSAATAKLTLVQRKVDRMTLKHDEDMKKVRSEAASAAAAAAAAAADATAAGGSSNGGMPSSGNGTAAAAGASSAQVAALESDIEQLKTDLEEAQTLASMRLSREGTLKDEMMELRQQLRKAENITITDEAISETPLYRVLYEKYRNSMQRNTQLTDQCDMLQRKCVAVEDNCKRLEDEHMKLTVSKAQELSDVVVTLQRQLHGIVAERDHLRARLDSMPSVQDQQKTQTTLNELQALTDLQVGQIKLLREQRTKFHDSWDPELKSRQALVVLLRQHKEAEKKAKNLERSLRVSLETYKSVSRENRDSHAIRESERQLASENKQLKEQVATLQREAEGKDPESRVRDVQEELETTKQELANQQEVASALMAEIDDLAKSFDDMQEQNTRLLRQLSDAETLRATHNAERYKHRQECSQLERERDSWKQQVAALKKLSDDVQGAAAEMETKLDAVDQRLIKTQEQLQATEQKAAAYEEHARENRALALDYQQQLNQASERFKDITEAMDAETKHHDQRDRKLRRAEEKVTTLTRKLARLAASSSSSGSSGASADLDSTGLHDELRLLKQQLKCSVCASRKKNVVITKCFHTFCKECIDENVRTRHRKCPACGIPFDARDVKEVYI